MHHTPRSIALAAAGLLGTLACLPAQSQSMEATRSVAQRALQGSPDVTSRLNAYLGKIEAQTVAAAALCHEVDKQVCERQRLGPQRNHAAQWQGSQDRVQPALQRRHVQNRLGAAQVARDSGCGRIAGRERKWRSVAPPAAQGLLHFNVLSLAVPGIDP